MIKKFALIILSCALLTACLEQDHSKEINFSTAPLTLITQAGQEHTLIVEVAKTEPEREKGLMFREELADDRGMIFIFDQPSIQSFWMKNTLIFLDMIFIDENSRIVKIHPMAQPHNTHSISSEIPVKAVLEVRGGLAEKLGIRVNDRIDFKGL